jgi:hypothetical protein
MGPQQRCRACIYPAARPNDGGTMNRVASLVTALITLTLDFDVFTNQKWDRLHESHAKDITS